MRPLRFVAPALAPLTTVFVLVLLWGLAVEWWKPPSHLMPSPWQVLQRIGEGLLTQRDLLPQFGATLLASLIGYGVGTLVALVAAVLITEFRVVERALYPVVLFFQSIPKVSLAPLVFIWAGFGLTSQVLLVALICFFPFFTSALAGLQQVDANLVDLFRVSGAGRWHRLLHLKLPAAAGQLFVGLQVAFVFALIGCVVMEFINATQGAGFLIVNASNTLDTTTSIAAMVVLGLLGWVGSECVRAVGRRIVFWERPAKGVRAAEQAGAL